MRTVTHGRITLAVHELQPGEGRPLLLLHGLGEQTPAALPAHLEDRWRGPVLGLDFTGHGASTVPVGGGYYCEILMGDVDAVVESTGPVTILGRGLGAYVGLLIAGARPIDVRGVVLTDGPGLFGGSAGPSSPAVVIVDPTAPSPPDPYALVELARDVRPPDYATSFTRQATHLSGLTTPISVAAIGRPPWLAAVVDEPGVQESTVDEALALYAGLD